MARPPLVIDMTQLETMMRWKPTLRDCAAFFKCSEDTIERRINEATGQTFVEFRDSHLVFTKSELIGKALLRADKSDALLIFCLKNLCGWRDKQPDEDQPSAVVNNNQMVLTEDKFIELVKAARGIK